MKKLKFLLHNFLNFLPYLLLIISIVLLAVCANFDDIVGFESPDGWILLVVLGFCTMLVGSIFLAKTPISIDSIKTIRYFGRDYEVIYKNGKIDDIESKGSLGNAYVVANFLINLIITPIKLIDFLITSILGLFNKKCRDIVDDKYYESISLTKFSYIGFILTILIATTFILIKNGYRVSNDVNDLKISDVTFEIKNEKNINYFNWSIELESEKIESCNIKLKSIEINNKTYDYNVKCQSKKENNKLYASDSTEINKFDFSKKIYSVIKDNKNDIYLNIEFTSIKFPNVTYYCNYSVFWS